jgi:hypothetical protein
MITKYSDFDENLPSAPSRSSRRSQRLLRKFVSYSRYLPFECPETLSKSEIVPDKIADADVNTPRGDDDDDNVDADDDDDGDDDNDDETRVLKG